MLHKLVHVALAIAFIAVCGGVTARWFALEADAHIDWKRAYRNKYFWLGAFAALVFLYSDYRFALLFTA